MNQENLRLCRINTGEVIIGELQENGDLTNPFILMPQGLEQGQMNLQVFPMTVMFNMFSNVKNEELTVSKTSMSINPIVPTKDLLDKFFRAKTGIEIAPANALDNIQTPQG